MENAHERFLALSEVLANYSMGNFDVKAELSDNLDEIDTIISGVNMLGEELKETTISRDFFSSVYNAVAEMLFIINKDGKIEDANSTAVHHIGLSLSNITGTKIDSWLSDNKAGTFTTIKRKLKDRKSYAFETVLLANENKKQVEVYCRCSKRTNRNGDVNGYLIIAEDITERKETEKRIMRAVVNTQEQVQKRVANDLHDAMGPELSMASMLLNSLLGKKDEFDEQTTDAIKNCREWVESSIRILRNICFDMLPSALETGNIVKALDMFAKKMNEQQELNFTFNIEGKTQELIKPIKIAIYRVAQEFSNNSLKHSEATDVELNLIFNRNKVEFTLSDNGKGFDIHKLTAEKRGRGLYTMHSRIEAFGGSFSLASEPGQGTISKVVFPLNDKTIAK